jgi:hypothetical protein
MKRKETRTDVRKKLMLAALEKALGVITLACKEVGVARQTHYEWYKEDEEYHSAVDSIADIAVDFAESKLHEQINKGDTTATIFYLKTKGKQRGYIERMDHDITSGGKPIINLVDGRK